MSLFHILFLYSSFFSYLLLFDVIASAESLCRPAGQNNTLTNAEAAAAAACARFSGSHLRIELLTLKTKFRIFKKLTILPLSHMKADKGPGWKDGWVHYGNCWRALLGKVTSSQRSSHPLEVNLAVPNTHERSGTWSACDSHQWEKRKLAVLLLLSQMFSATLHLSVFAHCNWCQEKPKGTLTGWLPVLNMRAWVLAIFPSFLHFFFPSLLLTHKEHKNIYTTVKDNIPSINERTHPKGILCVSLCVWSGPYLWSVLLTQDLEKNTKILSNFQ